MHSSPPPGHIIKGLGHEVEFEYFYNILFLNRSLNTVYLNMEDEPLMNCRLCHFHAVKGETYWENRRKEETTKRMEKPKRVTES
jgi:hypothetical protein